MKEKMTLQKLLTLQATNVTAFVVRALDRMPSEDDLIFGPLEDEWPENWVPLEIQELYSAANGVEVVAVDSEGHEVEMPVGSWVSMNDARAFWAQVVPFIIESSRGRELYVVENTNTMVYVPKCKVLIDSGLPDGSVMKAVTTPSGLHKYVRCPFGAEDASACEFPKCVGNLISTPQTSIRSAKIEYRKQACVFLTRESRNGGRILFMTNGPNHLNLVPLDQAVQTAWSSDWLMNLRKVIQELGFDEPSGLEEKLATLQGKEILRAQEAEEQFKAQRVQSEITLAEEELPENIVIKQSKQKQKD